VSDTSLKERNAEGTEKRLRVTLELSICFGEITQEMVRESYLWEDDFDWGWAERQQRLLRTLLKNEQALQKLLRYLIIEQLGDLTNSDLIKGIEVEEDEVILESVYSEMDEKDILFFQEVKKSGIFAENTQLIPMTWKIHWEEAKLIDIFAIVGGDQIKG
jgi:hypothetical protein